jgi:cell division protein FtsZ
VAVVTKPFGFEGPRRMKQADKGLAELGGTVDTVISIPNDRLQQLVPKGTSFFDAFRVADDVLRQAVQGISDIMTTPGIINRDFSDIRSIMLGMGYAMMGTASARGENAATVAAEQAISCALLEEGGVKGARGVLINITGSSRLGIHDVNAACSLIRQATQNDDVQINFGVVMNESMEDEVKITVIATGFQRENLTQLDRRSSPIIVNTVTVTPVPVQVAPVVTPVMEPVYEELKPDYFFEQAVEPEPEPEPPAPQVTAEPPAPAKQEDPALNDLETPAFLRRERRLFQ